MQREDYHQIIVTPRMLLDHTPDTVTSVLRGLAAQYESSISATEPHETWFRLFKNINLYMRKLYFLWVVCLCVPFGFPFSKSNHPFSTIFFKKVFGKYWWEGYQVRYYYSVKEFYIFYTLIHHHAIYEPLLTWSNPWSNHTVFVNSF